MYINHFKNDVMRQFVFVCFFVFVCVFVFFIGELTGEVGQVISELVPVRADSLASLSSCAVQ